MKRVYRAENSIVLGHLKRILEDHHIQCIAKNQYLMGGVGELPPNECWPELWVAEDFQYHKALDLIETALATSPLSNIQWRCNRCGELLEGQFTTCWSCGNHRPDEPN